MGGSQRIPHEYKESESFGSQADAIGLTPKKRDESLKGFLFVVARIPTEFGHIPSTNLYRGIYKLDDGRWVRIWYTFDGSIIVLRGIELYE